MFEAYGRNWRQPKEGFILRKNEFLVDCIQVTGMQGPVSFVCSCMSCPAHLPGAPSRVGWMTWYYGIGKGSCLSQRS